MKAKVIHVWISVHQITDYPYDVTVTRCKRKKEIKRHYQVNPKHDVMGMISGIINNRKEYQTWTDLRVYPTISIFRK